MRTILRAAVRLALILFALVPSAAMALEPSFMPIEVAARPIVVFRPGTAGDRVGWLEFRGGLVLSSPDRHFGSLSGLDFAPDGKTLYAVADTGFWFTARIEENDGRLTGLSDAKLAPILDRHGRPIVGKRLGDAESLRLVSRGSKLTALVSFEQTNDVRRFTAAPDLAHSPSESVKLPSSVSGMPANKGLEAIAVAPSTCPLAGATLLFAERSLDHHGNNRAWIADGPLAGSFSLRRSEDFNVTDATFLADCDLLVLERKFDFSEGLAMRLRRIAGGDLKPGATVDSKVLIEANLADQIDNMEGLAVRKDDRGETLIDMVSDDNQSVLQRTILLQFAIVE